MSESLKILASSREARREAAVSKLLAAKREYGLVHAACERAHAAVEQSRQWRADVLKRCALGASQGLRESMLPACEALLQQRQQQFARMQNELRLAEEHMTAQRQDLTARERDTLRLQEWQNLLNAQERREQAMQESRQGDDHVPARRLGMGAS
jgi:hypothetical protein